MSLTEEQTSELNMLETEVIAKGGPNKGEVKQSAPQHMVDRYNELKAIQAAAHSGTSESAANPISVAGASEAAPDGPTAGDAVTAESIAAAEKDAEIARLQAENAALKAPKGIPALKDTKKKPDGTVIRDEERLKGILTDALKKDKPEDLTDLERCAIERERRRYLKKGGVRLGYDGRPMIDPKTNKPEEIPSGYRKGLSESDKKRCDVLSLRLGRTGADKLTWDESIVVPGIDRVDTEVG